MMDSNTTVAAFDEAEGQSGTGNTAPAATIPATPQVEPAPVVPATKAHTRRRGLLILAAIVVIALAAWAIHAFFFAAAVESTDDAYVAGDVVAITSREAGTVIALRADNTEAVRRGQPLIDLDPATSDVSLASAAAELGRAVRSVRTDVSEVDTAKAGMAQAQAELSRARNDLVRRRGAAADGAVSGEEVAHAADAVTTANAGLALARSRLVQAQSTVQGVSVADNPAVLAAIARYRTAAIMRSHLHLTAPVDGIVAQRTVQLGQQVAPGTPLMAVVPLRNVWVDANFRETQLRHIRVGQPVTITTDVYGKDVVYHGRVLGLGAGSGNAFGLLPPQNASGNWIKIVQRLPVRIALTPDELDRNPLRIGLSVTAKVDVAHSGGALVARSAGHSVQVQPSQDGGEQVEGDIRRIIAANMGSRG